MISSVRLDEARRCGDDVADRLVSDMGPRVWATNALLAAVTRTDDLRPPGVSDALWALVAPRAPAWADPHRLRAAQAFADRNLAVITLALFCAALPASYGDREGARLLAATGRMHRDLDRRVNETARFLFDVLRPNSFDRGGRALVSIGKVRVVHAAVRTTFRDRAAFVETPINQEQMLGTICLFSVAVLDAIERLGVTVEGRDGEDFVHLWRVTGALLGIDADLLPESRAEAAALYRDLKRRRFAPSEEGKALLEDLVLAMERHARMFGMGEVPRTMIRHLLGAENAERMGVRPSESAGRWRTWSTAGALRPPALAPRFGRVLLETVNALKLGARPVTFPMPAVPGQDQER
jgi:hypothetical protein